MGELLRELNQAGTVVESSPVSPDRLVELLQLVHDGTIILKAAEDIFPEVYSGEKSDRQFGRANGWKLVHE